MQRRRDLFSNVASELFHSQLEKPGSALYAFIPLSIFKTFLNSSELCTQFMTQDNLACVPVISFGQKGYLQMAFSEKEDVIQEGLQTLRKVQLK